MLINIALVSGALFIGLLFFGNPENDLQLSALPTFGFVFSLCVFFMSPLPIYHVFKCLLLFMAFFYAIGSFACWYVFIGKRT